SFLPFIRSSFISPLIHPPLACLLDAFLFLPNYSLYLAVPVAPVARAIINQNFLSSVNVFSRLDEHALKCVDVLNSISNFLEAHAESLLRWPPWLTVRVKAGGLLEFCISLVWVKRVVHD